MHTVRKVVSRFPVALRAKSACGADICGGAVRMLRLSAGGVNRVRLEKFASVPLPQGIIINGRIRNYETLLPLIASAAGRLYGSSRLSSLLRRRIPLIAALPRSLSFVETVWPSENGLPDEDEAERFRRRFPDIEMTVGLSPAAAPLPTLLAAAKREDAEAYAEAFDGAGRPLACLDTEWTAYANAFRYWLAVQNDAPPPVCAWIAADGTNWPGMVFSEGHPVYFQELAADSAPLFGTLPSENGTPFALSQIRNNPSDAAVQEILRFIRFYRASPAAAQAGGIGCILLSGSNVPPEAVLNALSAECGLPVRRICPAALLSDDEAWQKEAAAFNLAFGLALHGAWR